MCWSFQAHPGLWKRCGNIVKGQIWKEFSAVCNRLVRPRELGGLRATVRGLPAIRQLLTDLWEDLSSHSKISRKIELFEDLTDLLNRALEEELPAEINSMLKDRADG